MLKTLNQWTGVVFAIIMWFLLFPYIYKSTMFVVNTKRIVPLERTGFPEIVYPEEIIWFPEQDVHAAKVRGYDKPLLMDESINDVDISEIKYIKVKLVPDEDGRMLPIGTAYKK